MKVFRVILGVVVGLGAAFTIALFAEQSGYGLHPIPANIDWSDVDSVKSYTDSLPPGAVLLLLAGWVGGTFVGALTGSAISRPRAILISIIVGGLMLAATIVNFLLTPHPWWLVVATIIGIVAATWLAAKLLWKPVLPPTSA